MSSLRNNLDRLESRNAESIQRLNQQNNTEKETLKYTIQTLREEIESIHVQRETSLQEANRIKNLEIQQLRKSLVHVRNSLEREKQHLMTPFKKTLLNLREKLIYLNL